MWRPRWPCLALTQSPTHLTRSILRVPSQSLHCFFGAHSKVVWDGTPVENVHEFFTTVLPSTKHDVLSFDVQPVLPIQVELTVESKAETQSALLVLVTGDVKYGVKEQNEGFVHSFVLEPDLSKPAGGNFYYIASANCRTHKGGLRKPGRFAGTGWGGGGGGGGHQGGGGGGGGGGAHHGGGGYHGGGR